MKKVGILSMQRIFNYGSFLQAYGLKSIIEEFNCKVEFVDYHVGECLIPSDDGTGFKRKVSKVLEVFKYNAPLKEKIRFIKYKKEYAKKNFPYLGITEEMNYNPLVDLLVIGSDEVFNCVQNNTNVGFSPELFGANNNAKKVISYAACFGNTTIEKLTKYNVEKQVSELLCQMDAISVRDNNSGNLVKILTGNTPEYNLDPVLAYDFVGKCKDIPNKISESNYMILYGYSGRFTKSECDLIKRYARKKGLKVFCIGGVQDCCDKFIDCNPFEVIAYFQHADCVVTDTFHGTILSVITHRNFATVIRKQGYGNLEKLSDLLNRLKLSNRAIQNMGLLEDLMNNPVDYNETDEIISKERKHTYEYLEGQLK